jgi:hypothetical protein
LTIEGTEWVLVGLILGSFVSDPKKVPDRMRSLMKVKEQFDRLSEQAKEAIELSIRDIERETGQPETFRFGSKEPPEDGTMALLDLAHRLGLKTEGKTAEEISNAIASLPSVSSKVKPAKLKGAGRQTRRA